MIEAAAETHELLELQITQEYTGQATDVYWLVPQWKEAPDFDTRADGASPHVGPAPSPDQRPSRFNPSSS
jgi:alpha-glucuronidase